jgi:hypothetical protein
MKTLVAYDGRTSTLSDEVYQITGKEKDHPQPFGYGVGACVRLISGIDGSPTPGHHFSNEYLTVCSITATTAEFVGIKRKHLKDITNRPIKE